MKNWGRFVCMLLIMCMPQCVVAGIVVASTEYVSGAIDAKTSTKVDTGQVTQTLRGSYTITGAIMVPTPPLPAAS